MRRTLDRNRPFAEHFGLEPIKYAQDGHAFLENGDLAPDPDEPEPPRSDFIDRLMAPVAEPEPATSPKRLKNPDDLRLAENKALKVQLETYGVEWQGVEHARRYLGMKDDHDSTGQPH